MLNSTKKDGQLLPASLASLQNELRGWRSNLILTPTKSPRAQLANALIALRQAPEWQGVLGYDEFALTIRLLKAPPWLKHEDNRWTPQRWTDRDDALTANWLQHNEIGVTVATAATATETVAKDHTFHPIRDYLNKLEWDGTKRVANFASTYLGAEATAYHSAVSQNMLVAAVARVMQPGCKADYVPILEGAQDKGKSTAIELLFSSPWFSDDLDQLGTKDAAMQVRVAWCIEIAELASMTRAEIERVKAFITRKVDRFRPSYGRHVVEVPRQSIFIGSTNNETYLKDETGGRRFWPIRCGTIDLKAIERDRDQLWAESTALHKAGTPWWFSDKAVIAVAREEQAARYVEDPWQSLICEYLQGRGDTSIADVLLHIQLDRGRWTQADQNRVARCLRTLGWERYRRSTPPRDWRYRRAATVPVCPSIEEPDRDGQVIEI
jgi:predicted P-loop ATPase